MLWVPQKGKLLRQDNGPSVGTAFGSFGTSATTGAASSTKGTPAEVFASTSFETYLMDVGIFGYGVNATDARLCVDVLAGAATEEVIIADLLAGNAQADVVGSAPIGGYHYLFPLYIPAGTRIAVQGAGDRVSSAFRVFIILWGGDALPPFRVGRKVTTYGITTVPAGTTITPGATGAQGAFAEITASTSEDHFAVIPGFQAGLDTTKGGQLHTVGVGLGAATEELIDEWYFGMNGNEMAMGPWPTFPHFMDIPSGTRIAMRSSNSIGNDVGSYNGAIYAVS